MFKTLYSNKLAYLSQLICLCLFTAMFLGSQVFADDLDSVQHQIKENQKAKLEKQKQQKKLELELIQNEKAIAKSSLKVSQTKEKISGQRMELISLQKKSEALIIEKKKQQSLLEQQLTSAYMAGQNDLVKLILNQEDLSKVVRAKSYYHYLNQARLDSIDELQQTQQKLKENKVKQEATLASLRETYEEQKTIEANVRAQKSKRNKTLRTLNKELSYRTNKLAELNSLEKQLRNSIKKAAEARARAINKAKQIAILKAKQAKKKANEQKEREDIKIAAAAAKKAHNVKFSSLKRKLNWPLKGKVLHRFGSKRSSQVKWKGITLSAYEGEKVRAVASGQVLYAGYFKGYGMVIAIDHGDNYITLYGYNQTLLKSAGESIQQGEAIALAGNSGGQEKSSLYFELNHKGRAQNPLSWLSKKAR